MGRCPPERLDDLTDVLDEVRMWPDIVERAPGTFTIKRNAFLHFHLTGTRRWADVRGADGWAEVEIPLGANAKERRQFVAALRTYYEAARS